MKGKFSARTVGQQKYTGTIREAILKKFIQEIANGVLIPCEANEIRT